MRTLHGVLVGAIALTLTVVAPPLAANAAPVAPYTAFVLNPPEGGNWPVKQSLSFDPSNSTINFGEPFANTFDFSAQSPGGDAYHVAIAPPTGQNWVVGTTYQSRRDASASFAEFDLGAGSRGCNQSFGTFTLKELTRDAENAVTALAITYSTGCETASVLVHGEIRWNSTLGYAASTVDLLAHEYYVQYIGEIGEAKTFTVTSAGSESTVFGAVSLGGAAPASFVVTGNTCSGQTKSYGQTCTVTVNARPTTNGSLDATLLIADNTNGGGKRVALHTTGVNNAEGTFTALYPSRILDTRSGNGASGPVGAGQTINLNVHGRGGIPWGSVSAVVLNVTVTGGTSGSYVTVFPTGVSRPLASSMNFPAGWTGANSVTVGVGTDGHVSFYNELGNVHIIADVVGFFASEGQSNGGGQYQPVVPERLFDSRVDWGDTLCADCWLELWVSYGEQNNPHLRALAVNITAVTPAGGGFLTSWAAGGSPMPLASTLNYQAGEVVPNFAVVPVGMVDGFPAINIYSFAETHLIVDIVGIFDDGTLPDGLRFEPMTPTRIVDTRTGQGAPAAIGQNAVATVTTPGSVATPGTEALAMNVLGIQPTNSTYLTVWPEGISGIEQPYVSNLNLSPGQVDPNAAISLIGPNGKFNIYNAQGSTHCVIDVVGRYYLYPPASAASANGAASTGLKATGSPLTLVKKPAILHKP